MKWISVLFTLMSAFCFAQQPQSVVDRAKEAIPQLRDQMKDPDSLVIDKVFVKDDGNFCYHFLSKNGYGGYTEGLAFYGLAVKGRNAGKWVPFVINSTGDWNYLNHCNFLNKNQSKHMIDISSEVLAEKSK